MSHRMGVAERRHQPNRTPASQPTPPVLRDADFRAKRSIRLRAGDSSTGGKALGVSAGFTEYAPAFEEFRRLYRVSIYDLLKALRQPRHPLPRQGMMDQFDQKTDVLLRGRSHGPCASGCSGCFPRTFGVSDDRFNLSLLPEFIGLYALKICSQPTASYVLTLNPAPSAHRVYRIREADSAREFEADAYVHGRVHVKRAQRGCSRTGYSKIRNFSNAFRGRL